MVSKKRQRSGSVSSIPVAESPFRNIKFECTMSISPAYIGRAHQGVNEILNAKLLKYDEQLSGIVLSFSHVRLEQAYGVVFDDTPEIQYRVKAHALIFAAPKGLRLTGMVNQIAAGHIHLLVCGAFQVVISSDRIPSSYVYSTTLKHFQNDDDDIIEVGSKLAFRIEQVRDQGGPWYIEGSLLDLDQSKFSKSTKKKNKK